MPENPRVTRSRRRVLEAAAALLLEEGPAGFTVQKVVQRSGVARQTVYRHWPTTEALLVDAFRHAVPDAGAPDVRAGDDPVEALTSTVVAYARDFRGAAWARVMPALLDHAARDPALDAIRDEHAGARRRHLVGLLDACVARGLLNADVDRDLAVAQLVGPLAFRAMLSHEPVGDDVAEAVVTAFLRAHAPG